MPRRVGLTTTVPVEVILAAGFTPVDLNNIFITSPRSEALVAHAERDGYPDNVCGWIKGIYSATLEHGIDHLVAVTQGDCSQTHAMVETLQARGVRVFPFAYPYDRDPELLRLQIERMAVHFGTSWEAAESVRRDLLPVRELLADLDRLTWEEDRVTGLENHNWLVSSSDFTGDVKGFREQVAKVVADARQRPAQSGRVRLGVIGVPPIITDFYQWLEGVGGQVVFNEVQRQFAMIACAECDLLEQYRRYTYPYDVFGRIADIREQIERRRIAGIIHYVQSFCFRQIQDMLLKQELQVPVLTLQGDKPTPLDARSRLRLEAFLETLEARAS